MKIFYASLALLFSLSLTAQPITEVSIRISSADEPGRPAMTWEVASHDFGQVRVGQKAVHTFVVRNTGNAPLQLTSVKPSCSCTVTDYTKEAIAPGEEGYVTASYAAKHKGYFTKAVTVSTNTEVGTMVLRLKGEVVEEAAH